MGLGSFPEVTDALLGSFQSTLPLGSSSPQRPQALRRTPFLSPLGPGPCSLPLLTPRSSPCVAGDGQALQGPSPGS